MLLKRVDVQVAIFFLKGLLIKYEHVKRASKLQSERHLVSGN